jgi:hypothetical protein
MEKPQNKGSIYDIRRYNYIFLLLCVDHECPLLQDCDTTCAANRIASEAEETATLVSKNPNSRLAYLNWRSTMKDTFFALRAEKKH